MKLFPYQKKGVDFILREKKVIIADEMGLGKSAQALMAMNKLGFQKVLIACPASLQSNWQIEAKKWINKVPEIIYHSQDIRNFNVISYSRIHKLSPNLIKKYQMIILDESHYIKNIKAKRTIAVLKIIQGISYRVLLTGTPILNRPIELVPQLQAIGLLHSNKKKWQFIYKYCNPKKGFFGWDFTGSSELKDLSKRLSPFMLRRSKRQVLPQLPKKHVYSTLLDMPDPQGYQRVLEHHDHSIKTKNIKYQALFKNLQDLSNNERKRYIERLENQEYNQLKYAVLTKIEKLRQITVKQKIQASKYLLDTFEDYGTKVIVFCTHRNTIKLLQKRYKPVSISISGEVPVKKRQSLIETFQQDPNIIFLFATIQTVGTGYTLTQAQNIIFLELGWTPAEHKQAEDRIHRIGQKKQVNINYLVLKDSIDEEIIKLLFEKNEVSEEITKRKLMDNFILQSIS